jgi:ATP-dependent Clp protease protease subunit
MKTPFITFIGYMMQVIFLTVSLSSAWANDDDEDDKEEIEQEEIENDRPKTALELKYEAELAILKYQKSRLELEFEIEEQKQKKKDNGLEVNKSRLTLENDILEQELRQENLKKDLLKVRPHYRLDPMEDGRLFISDRRISLNGVILSKTANTVTERIHFFNNQSTKYPIFIVIDRSPGGSVMEGARILQAMQNSQAPVYVVVKSLAASMAAIITALAKRSYAYPNAMILHHQMFGIYIGNSTQVKERLRLSDSWTKRLLKPVAHKMNLNLNEFIEAMYEHNTGGNWVEFAEEAQKNTWLTHTVDRIQETSYVEEKQENEEEQETNLEANIKRIDGKLQYQLPILSAGDFYHLYNPNEYYRASE